MDSLWSAYVTGFTLRRVRDMTRTYSQCTFNHFHSEAGVISNIFPLLKPKINNKCIQYDEASNVKIKGYLLCEQWMVNLLKVIWISGKELTEKERFRNLGLISNWIQFSKMLIRSLEQNWALLNYRTHFFYR